MKKVEKEDCVEHVHANSIVKKRKDERTKESKNESNQKKGRAVW